MRYAFTRKVQVALLILGSAILLFSCESKKEEAAAGNDASIMSEFSEDMSIVMSQNGRRSYFFEAPLLEGYTLGPEPYREFRKGIKITTYQDDSLAKVDLVLTANYAIYYEKRELWEAKGDVVGRKFDGKQLFTQQLFWDARTQKVYSNVDTKLVQGNNVSVGESFEANEDLSDWRFRYQKSRIEVEFKPGEEPDSAARQEAEQSRLKSRPTGRSAARNSSESSARSKRSTNTQSSILRRSTTPPARPDRRKEARPALADPAPVLLQNSQLEAAKPIQREATIASEAMLTPEKMK